MRASDEVCSEFRGKKRACAHRVEPSEVEEMERNKREKKVLSDAAELFDLPADLLMGLPHVEVMGDRQFYMENHRGILSYSDEEISISAEGIIIRVRGKGLELVSMSGEALRIRGAISHVEWVK